MQFIVEARDVYADDLLYCLHCRCHYVIMSLHVSLFCNFTFTENFIKPIINGKAVVVYIDPTRYIIKSDFIYSNPIKSKTNTPLSMYKTTEK